MIASRLGVGLLVLCASCAPPRKTVSVYQSCNTVGFCTDVQFDTSGRAAAARDAEWPSYGRTPYGDRHSPLKQIDTGNVSRLQVAWRFHTGEAAPALATRSPTALEVTPIVSGGTMYLSTPLGRVFALDPVTGRQRWTYDPGIDRSVRYGDFANRGVALWRDSSRSAGSRCSLRIFVATIDTRLIALDAATGQPCADFGTAGTVQLSDGLRNPPGFAAEYEETSPPTVVGGVVVVGSAVADNNRTDAASGEVRGFDARTGTLRWTFDPVPQKPNDPAYTTWNGVDAHRSGGANAWTAFAADPVRRVVYITTSSPSVDYFGGNRRGKNEYANSTVAIQAETGKVLWHFQTVHHDLWDYDNAAPPLLVDLHIGRERPALLQATKTGQLFVLDRDTGVPVFPVVESPVPASDVPGEEAWQSQVSSTGLPPLSPQVLSRDSVFGLTPEDMAACLQRFDSLRYEGPFTPPSIKGSLVLPSNVGGAHWGGAAFDPARDVVIIPVNRIAAVITLIPRSVFAAIREKATVGERIGTEYAMMNGTPYVLKRELFLAPSGAPCTPPPFGSLVAISLRTRQIVWNVPLGNSENLEKIGLHVPPDVPGAINLGGPITTAGGLVFIGAATDRYLHAFNIADGRELWRTQLPAGGKATPMTFLGADGRQYVVIAAGGDGKAWGWSDEVIAFALPPSRP